jgi:hypothetical protein
VPRSVREAHSLALVRFVSGDFALPPPDTLSRALLRHARSVSASAKATADAPKRLRREGGRVAHSLSLVRFRPSV